MIVWKNKIEQLIIRLIWAIIVCGALGILYIWIRIISICLN